MMTWQDWDMLQTEFSEDENFYHYAEAQKQQADIEELGTGGEADADG